MWYYIFVTILASDLFNYQSESSCVYTCNLYLSQGESCYIVTSTQSACDLHQ